MPSVVALAVLPCERFVGVEMDVRVGHGMGLVVG
jgi:hypothetical protein